MKPRSLTPLWRISRSSRRATAWKNVACDSENARWCTQPGSVGVRSGSASRSSLVNTVMSRPSPGSKYRWLSDRLSRLGCSKTNGMPSTPSQKSIDVRRAAPTIVMWCKPWLWSFRTRPPPLVLDEFRLVLAALQGPPRHEVDPRGHKQRAAQAVADRLGQRLVGARAARELDADRQRRLLLDARVRRPHEDVAGDPGLEGADDLAHGGGEQVDAADDEHVVGAPEAAHARAGAPAAARAHADLDVGARAEAQQRRRAVAQVGEDEFARAAVLQRQCGARIGIDQLEVHEAARAEVHAVLGLALAEQRHPDVADAHRLGHLRAPPLLEPGAERRLAAARLAGDEHAPHARRAQVDVALGRPLDQMGGVGGRQDRGLWRQQPDRPHEALGVAGPDRDVAEPDALEGGQRGAGRERAGVVGGDDALAGRDARRGVAAGRAGDP